MAETHRSERQLGIGLGVGYVNCAPSSATTAVIEPRLGLIGDPEMFDEFPVMADNRDHVVLAILPAFGCCPARLCKVAQRVAMMASRTGCSSVVERLMSKNFVVAVCAPGLVVPACAMDLLEQPHVLDRDHRLIAKVVTSSISFAVKG